MWFDKLVKSKNDGIIPLLSLFESEEDFARHFFKNVKFFNVEHVENQAAILLNQIKNNERIPVRYSQKSKALFYHLNDANLNGIAKKGFQNKREAKVFSQANDMFHSETKIRVCIDKDGNYYVRKQILEAIGYKVSQGSKSDINNYVISHVWGNTHNPLFFTSLWNVILVPNHLAFILDKPDANGEIARKMKIIAKAVCHYLYNPNELMGMSSIPSTLINSDELKRAVELAQIFVNEKTITFIDKSIVTV